MDEYIHVNAVLTNEELKGAGKAVGLCLDLRTHPSQQIRNNPLGLNVRTVGALRGSMNPLGLV